MIQKLLSLILSSAIVANLFPVSIDHNHEYLHEVGNVSQEETQPASQDSPESDPDQESPSGSTLTIPFTGTSGITDSGTSLYRLHTEEGAELSFGPSFLEEGDYSYQWQCWNQEVGRYEDISLADNTTAQSAELTIAVTEQDLDPKNSYRCQVSDGTAATAAVFALSEDIPVYPSADALILGLRAAMKAREKYFTATLTSGEVVDTTKVFEHTGVPDEGDYLRNHASIWRSNQEERDDGSITYSYTMNYVTTAEQEAVVSAMVQTIIADIDTSSNYSAIFDIYSYIRENVAYDHYHYGNVLDDFSNKVKQTAYGALVDGTCVCEGFASLCACLAVATHSQKST